MFSFSNWELLEGKVLYSNKVSSKNEKVIQL